MYCDLLWKQATTFHKECCINTGLWGTTVFIEWILACEVGNRWSDGDLAMGITTQNDLYKSLQILNHGVTHVFRVFMIMICRRVWKWESGIQELEQTSCRLLCAYALYSAHDVYHVWENLLKQEFPGVSKIYVSTGNQMTTFIRMLSVKPSNTRVTGGFRQVGVPWR